MVKVDAFVLANAENTYVSGSAVIREYALIYENARVTDFAEVSARTVLAENVWTYQTADLMNGCWYRNWDRLIGRLLFGMSHFGIYC